MSLGSHVLCRREFDDPDSIAVLTEFQGELFGLNSPVMQASADIWTQNENEEEMPDITFQMADSIDCLRAMPATSPPMQLHLNSRIWPHSSLNNSSNNTFTNDDATADQNIVGGAWPGENVDLIEMLVKEIPHGPFPEVHFDEIEKLLSHGVPDQQSLVISKKIEAKRAEARNYEEVLLKVMNGTAEVRGKDIASIRKAIQNKKERLTNLRSKAIARHKKPASTTGRKRTSDPFQALLNAKECGNLYGDTFKCGFVLGRHKETIVFILKDCIECIETYIEAKNK